MSCRTGRGLEASLLHAQTGRTRVVLARLSQGHRDVKQPDRQTTAQEGQRTAGGHRPLSVLLLTDPATSALSLSNTRTHKQDGL